jgi:CubicO group peptidase (beta-lactamase class C family)
MKYFINGFVSFCLAVFSLSSLAVDSYNSGNGQLTIPSVLLGNTTYNNVVINVGSVLSVGNAPALNVIDVFTPSNNQLYVPAVTVGNSTYYNVVATVGNVISVTGVSNKTLSSAGQNQLDNLIQSFMSSNGISAASLSVVSGGSVIYDKSYGYQDSNKSIPLINDPLMVTASVVKPITAAVIQNLASKQVLSLQDHVFCTGNNAPCWLTVKSPSGAIVNGSNGGPSGFAGSGYANITIQNLIDHEGGWDRELTSCYGASNFLTIGGTPNPTPCDPMLQEALIQQVLHGTFPLNFSANQLPTQMNDIYYWVTNNRLDHVPGTYQAYSNFGYMLLTAIASQATGIDISNYNSYVYNTLFAPMGISSSDFQTFTFTPSAGSPQYSRTPAMFTNIQCASIYSPGNYVAGTTQGCLNPVNWVGASTTLTTSKTLALFASVYLIDNANNLNSYLNPSLDGPKNGTLLSGSTNSGEHNGDLPGVTNILRQLPSGTSYTLMLNRDNQNGIWENNLYSQIDNILHGSGF